MAPENITLTVGIISAISGLVGVIVGGIITAGSNYLLYQKRVQTERERDSRNHAIEIRGTSRLIDADLSRAIAVARICIDERHWWSPDVQPLTLEGWEQHRGIVAPELTENAWLAVRVAVEAVDNLKTARMHSYRVWPNHNKRQDRRADRSHIERH
jgi:hypothetical protein